MNHVHDKAFWDERYRTRTAPWDPDPNPFLPADLAGLTPGTALDVACGEGSDAVWLAKHGWRVTAVDISDAAIERGRAADVDGLVTWLATDVLAWEPPADAFDLVTMHFMHIPPEARKTLFSRLSGAVKPGGVMLVVAHHPSDLETSLGRPPLPELYYTAEEVLPLLDRGHWEPLVAGTRPREVQDREGRTITIHDTLLKARRRAG